MYIFASFDHGPFLEIAIADLTRIGLTKKEVMAVPLRKTTRKISVFDRMYRADGVSILDGAALLATLCMLFGTVWGSVLYWGPIIWGLLGFFAGAIIGLIIDWVVTTKNIKSDQRNNPIPVVLIVRCGESQAETVERILEEHHALALARHYKAETVSASAINESC
ncbi:MAG: hypothetical protein H6Q35_2760 [Proteobacteria bacterium]|nr:hypothetical protein [Pseudomonadota bacterium]